MKTVLTEYSGKFSSTSSKVFSIYTVIQCANHVYKTWSHSIKEVCWSGQWWAAMLRDLWQFSAAWWGAIWSVTLTVVSCRIIVVKCGESIWKLSFFFLVVIVSSFWLGGTWTGTAKREYTVKVKVKQNSKMHAANILLKSPCKNEMKWKNWTLQVWKSELQVLSFAS